MLKQFILLCCLFGLMAAFAKPTPTPISTAPLTQEELFKKMLENQQKRIKALLNDNEDFWQDFEKDMGKMMESFEEMGENLEKRLGAPGVGGGGFFQFGSNQIPHEWRETPQERILVLMAEQGPNNPIDLKIENGMVNVSCKMEIKEEKEQQAPAPKGGKKSSAPGAVKSQSLRQFSFQQNYSIPDDVEESKAYIENKGKQGIWIRFPKKGAAPVKALPTSGPSPTPQITPFSPKDGGQTI
ncbi:MAG: hypothetical protein WCG27_08310 [Pseudomonadota bacterium]